MYPSEEEIKALHKKYATNEKTFDLIYTHSQIVSEIASELLRVKPIPDIDKEFVKVASLLHDIGAYTFFNNGQPSAKEYIRHGIEGEEILKSENFDPKFCRVASHHTGVGLRKEHIIESGLPLPHEDFLAETPEEELIMYADKFHSKTPKFNSYESYLEHTSRFGEENAKEFKRLANKFGIPDLKPLAERYNQPLD
jgi:uncharacterized protein